MEKKNNGLKYFLILKTIINTLIIVIIVLYLSVIVIQKVSGNKTVLGIRVFNVVTASMIPVYNVNDVIAVKDINVNDLKVGDDIVYKGEKESVAGKIITHRIIDIKKENNETVITTKGVNNKIADPPITSSQVIGKALGKIPIITTINQIIQTQVGFFVIVFCPIVILASLEIAQTVIDHKLEKNELVEVE